MDLRALDYNPGRLNCLQARIDELGLDNVHPLQRAWEDDWSDVPVCDILIASRSAWSKTWTPRWRRPTADWYRADPELAREGVAPMRWAFIGWTLSS
ncbi:hypothetical protein [Stutzerimonas nitrititolerans]|uniref:hypothetical protein n=1 Tax=Stutzerimonas nitrititolerans TaxID=2482751 RepID=UPI00289FB0D7|nr:hypothetical protein [Stutzerimonas nitrititolerans]